MTKFAHYIAKRYLSASGKKTVISWMTRIAVSGITIITAALIILLSVFNGIESMIEDLYTDFDADLTIQPVSGKTFDEKDLHVASIDQVPGIEAKSRLIEEVVVVKHEQKWVNATLVGVDSAFLRGVKMDEHLIEGSALIQSDNKPYALVGAKLFEQLGGFLTQQVGEEQFILYAPKREVKIRPGTSPFSTELIAISGRFDFNKEVNSQIVLVPLDFARSILRYEKELTGYAIYLKSGQSLSEAKELLQKKVGSGFVIKTNLEKNALIFKTSQTEKVIVLGILLFVFVLASFNLMASITMLFIEKKDNIQTLIALGSNQATIHRIFFFEGIMIAGKGLLFGLVLGYGLCFLQLGTGWLTMPETGGQVFPVVISVSDAAIIVGSVSVLSLVFSYLPVYFLLQRNFGRISF